jgi:DNA-binding response OmpR family regulator/uncharacterized protein (DUF2225 family)
LSSERPVSGPLRTRVAVIDDDHDQRLLLRHALELRGYQVLEFESAEGALGWETLSEGGGSPPIAEADLILLDVNLPGITGVETLQLLKETPGLRTIPVAMLTAQSASETVLKCLRTGAVDYFVKPIDFSEAMRHIDKLLSDPSGLLSRTSSIDLKWSFQEFLIRELKRAERSEDQLAILMGGFRKAPVASPALSADEVGRLWSQPPEGGESLRKAVEAFVRDVQRHFREYDVLAPFGGGEFVAILPASNRESLNTVIRKLQAHFQTMGGFPPLSRQERWALLLGGACYPEDGRDRLMLLSSAEARLSDQPPVKSPHEKADDRLFAKSTRCSGCGNHFSFSKIAARRITPISRESDLRMIFDDIDPLLYGVVSCTSCGLAGFEADLPALRNLEAPAFGWSYQARSIQAPLTRPAKTVIPEDLSRHLSPSHEAWVERNRKGLVPHGLADDIPARDRLLHQAKVQEGLRVSRETAVVRHLLARETYRLAGASPLRRARLAHRLAWLHRTVADTEHEKQFLAEALEYYLIAFHFEDLVAAHPTEIEIFYLLGEISFRLGREADAVAIFDRLVRDPRLEEKDAFRKMVRRRWFEARHEPPAEA